MIETIPRSNASLPELLAQRARHASDARLAFDVGGGILMATIAAILTPPGWLQLLSAGLTFASFGAWGICDRMLSERSLPGASEPGRDAHGRWLRAARLAAAALGACAAVVLLFSVFALMLGTWIS